MISRLSAFAALFAVIATLLAVLSTANDASAASSQIERSSAPMKVYQLERVVVTGKRMTQAAEAR